MRTESAIPAQVPSTVIVFGATGFIGRNFVRFIKGSVKRILPVGRSANLIDDLQCLTLADLEQEKIEPDTVAVNLAAHRYDATDFSRAQSDILLRNVEIAGAVYDFCTRKGITEVRSASSIGVYPSDEESFNDTAPIRLELHPHDGELMYGWSKRIGELYAELFERKYGVNTLIFRLTNPYGPYDSDDETKAHVVPAFVIRALTSTGPFTVRGSVDASRDFIYVGDVCDVLWQSLLLRGRNGAYNLGSGENTTIGALAATVLRLVGAERQIVAHGNPVSAVKMRRCRNERLLKDFAISRFTSIEEGLVPTISWYRDALTVRR